MNHFCVKQVFVLKLLKVISINKTKSVIKTFLGKFGMSSNDVAKIEFLFVHRLKAAFSESEIQSQDMNSSCFPPKIKSSQQGQPIREVWFFAGK